MTLHIIQHHNSHLAALEPQHCPHSDSFTQVLQTLCPGHAALV